MKKMYIVSCIGGDESGYWVKPIFVTMSEPDAKKYVAKFNSILYKWKKYYESLLVKDEYGLASLPDECNFYERYWKIDEIALCDYNDVEFR